MDGSDMKTEYKPGIVMANQMTGNVKISNISYRTVPNQHFSRPGENFYIL